MSCQLIKSWKNHTPRNDVALPINSPFTKFAKRPKNIPIGDTQAKMSNIKKTGIFFLKKISMFQ